MLAMLPWNVDREIAGMIRSGNVVYELLRPRDLYAIWFSRILALRTAPTLLRAVPMFVVAMLFFGMQAPASVGSALAYVVSMLAAILLARRSPRSRASRCCGRSPATAFAHRAGAGDDPFGSDRAAAAVPGVGAERAELVAVSRDRGHPVQTVHGPHPGRQLPLYAG